MLENLEPKSWIAELAQVFILGCFEFYDKNPIAATTVYVAIGLTPIVYTGLNHFYKIKVADQKHLEKKMSLSLSLKLKKAKLEGNRR